MKGTRSADIYYVWRDINGIRLGDSEAIEPYTTIENLNSRIETLLAIESEKIVDGIYTTISSMDFDICVSNEV